jgi:hypothetical protein
MRTGLAAALVLLAAAALPACAGPSCARAYHIAPGPHAPFVWIATDPAEPHGQLTVVGTFHAAGEKDIPPEAARAVDDGQVFVAETDSAGRFDRYSSSDSWWKATHLPPGQSLQKLLSSDDFYDLQNILGLSAEDAARLKPWVAMLLVARRAMFFPTPSIDDALTARARRRGLELIFLETFEEQVAFLDQTTGAPDLRDAIHDFPVMRCRIADGVDAWRAGDGDALAHLDTPEQHARNLERNAAWLPRVLGVVRAGRRGVLVVGISHLLGDDGLVAVLAREGLKVERVPAR